jgi:hypothetical protein
MACNRWVIRSEDNQSPWSLCVSVCVYLKYLAAVSVSRYGSVAANNVTFGSGVRSESKTFDKSHLII